MDVYALADHIKSARWDFDAKVQAPITPTGTPPEKSVWVSRNTYLALLFAVKVGGYLFNANGCEDSSDFKMHVLGFRVHRDETLGPEDCRIVIRTKT
jgi:hypothetical protein